MDHLLQEVCNSSLVSVLRQGELHGEAASPAVRLAAGKFWGEWNRVSWSIVYRGKKRSDVSRGGRFWAQAGKEGDVLQFAGT